MNKVVTQSFTILTAVTSRVNDVLEVMSKFMFSKSSLKPSLNLVSNCIPFGLLQRKTLFFERTYKFQNVTFKISETFGITRCSNPVYSILPQLKGRKNF